MTDILRPWVDPECPYSADTHRSHFTAFLEGVKAAREANPEVVLPERQPSELISSWQAGWNRCLHEIERLNAPKPEPEPEPETRTYKVTVPADRPLGPDTWDLPSDAVVVEVTDDE